MLLAALAAGAYVREDDEDRRALHPDLVAGRAAQESKEDPTGLARFQDRQREAFEGDTDLDLPPEKGEPIAFVTAAIVTPDDAEEFLRGMDGSIRRNGGKEQAAAKIDGVEIDVFQLSDQAIMTFRGCHAVFVRGGDREKARLVVAPVVNSLR